jgi:hypothetical protein
MRGTKADFRPVEPEAVSPPGYHGPPWTPEQLALLGKEPDDLVAGKVGRSVNAVRIMRQLLGRPNPAARPGAYGSPRWSETEEDRVRRFHAVEAARRTGRTLAAVQNRRSLLLLKGVRPEGELLGRKIRGRFGKDAVLLTWHTSISVPYSGPGPVVPELSRWRGRWAFRTSRPG